MSAAGFTQPRKTLVMPKIKSTGTAKNPVGASGGASPANNASRSAGMSPTSPQKKPTGSRIHKNVGQGKGAKSLKGMYTNNGYQEFKSYKGD